MEGMQYDIGEILSQSIMIKRPFVVVEGIDDISIYDRVINGESRKAEIIAIETVEGFSKGCDSIVDAASVLEGLPSSQYNHSDYVVGIIDKDVRDYRGELPSSRYLLILDAYSIESHFVNSDVISYLLKLCTKGTSDLFTSRLSEKILRECVESMELLYLASLEALKGAIDSSYESEFGYGQAYGRLKDSNLSMKLRDKSVPLTAFANELSLDSSLPSLKKICKGKWLLSIFCEELERVIKGLPSNCGVEPVQACRMCIAEAENSCLYRLIDGFSHKNMREMAKQVADSSELSYIRERVVTMAMKVA